MVTIATFAVALTAFFVGNGVGMFVGGAVEGDMGGAVGGNVFGEEVTPTSSCPAFRSETSSIVIVSSGKIGSGACVSALLPL